MKAPQKISGCKLDIGYESGKSSLTETNELAEKVGGVKVNTSIGSSRQTTNIKNIKRQRYDSGKTVQHLGSRGTRRVRENRRSVLIKIYERTITNSNTVQSSRHSHQLPKHSHARTTMEEGIWKVPILKSIPPPSLTLCLNGCRRREDDGLVGHEAHPHVVASTSRMHPHVE